MDTNEIDNELLQDQISLWNADGTLGKDSIKTLAELNKEYELVLPHMSAQDLVDETFVIKGAKRLKSEYKGQEFYYFCVCQAKDKTEFTVSFGGAAVMQIIDRLIELGIKNAVKVTLRWTPTKKDEGFYTLE